MSNGNTLLLGLDGILVETVRVDHDGVRVLEVSTAAAWVGRCTKCRARSAAASRGWVTTRPRDITMGPGRPRMVWRKRQWLCTNSSCEKKTFTEATPGIPARARVTGRAKTEMAHAVLDGDRSVVSRPGGLPALMRPIGRRHGPASRPSDAKKAAMTVC